MIKVKSHKRKSKNGVSVVRQHSRKFKDGNAMGHKNKNRSVVNTRARKLLNDYEEDYFGGMPKDRKKAKMFGNSHPYREALKDAGAYNTFARPAVEAKKSAKLVKKYRHYLFGKKKQK